MGWQDRSIEEQRLFNPAFLGLITWSIVKGFWQASEEGLPFSLAFIAIPVCLHKSTREALPRSTRTTLAAWLQGNQQIRIGFAERARSLSPFIREGIIYTVAQGVIAIDNSGRLKEELTPRNLSRFLRESSDEVRNCVNKAGFIGKWFALSGPQETIMAMWGVRP